MIHKLSDQLRWTGKRLHDAALRGRKVILGIGGLGLIDGAVWHQSLTWGMISTGVSLLLLQFLSEDDVVTR
jgi:uncharacterized membrane protein